MSLPCIVHLDLKGAPWRVDYLCKVIALMKMNGAKGVLIEWEDTFPYTAELVNIGSLGGCNRENMYSLPEVLHILKCIKDHEMVTIPLVQTIGHMEYVLKHPNHRRLREYPRSPAVLCPSRPESLILVKSMIKQVLDVHSDADCIHIGADEAWHMNICADCQQRSLNNEHGSASLFLDHINAVATYIKSIRPKINILMWDDMIRNTPVAVMNAFKLGELVQPVVWNYNVKEQFAMDIKLWERYSFVFQLIWVASAYKGANGSCQMVCDVRRYASNQQAWCNELAIYEEAIKFTGIILTGWSRFDHFATLCELLPVALPSLVSCLRMWNTPNGFVDENLITEELGADEWVGQELARNVVAAHGIRNRALQYINGDQVTTWMNSWQIAHDYVSPHHVEIIAATAKNLQGEMQVIRRDLSCNLHALTGNRSAEEYLQTYVTPVDEQLKVLVARAEARAGTPAGISPRSNFRRE